MNSSAAKNWRDIKKINQYLNLEGKLLVWTKIYVAPQGFEHQVPYFVGIVELETGEKIEAQIVDCGEDELTKDLKVQTVVRRLGKPNPQDVIDYIIKVKPL